MTKPQKIVDRLARKIKKRYPYFTLKDAVEFAGYDMENESVKALFNEDYFGGPDTKSLQAYIDIMDVVVRFWESANMRREDRYGNIVEEYQNGKNIKELAWEKGVSTTAIYKALERRGVQFGRK